MAAFFGVTKYGIFIIMLFNFALNSYALAPEGIYRLLVLLLSTLSLIYCFYESFRQKMHLRMFCFIFLALLPWFFYLQMFLITGSFITDLEVISTTYKAQCVVYNIFRYILLLTAALMLLQSFFDELKKLIYS
ncbi:MAG: hypothetical protein ACI4UM_03235 [Succinivibrio sp.]